MDDTNTSYWHDAGDSSEWDRREAIREAALNRQLLIRVADALDGSGRWFAGRGARYLPDALRLLTSAAIAYQFAGLSRRGRVSARLAQWIYADFWRTSAGRNRLPTRRQRGLADHVERLTAELRRPPSWSELAKALGITLGSVRDLARRARQNGLVTWREGEARTITVCGRRPGGRA